MRISDLSSDVCFSELSVKGPALSGLETAIRNALEKSDRANPDIRERIYQSARHALDAGLGKQGIGDPQLVAAQRQRLERAIRTIEAEERAALQASAERKSVVYGKGVDALVDPG